MVERGQVAEGSATSVANDDPGVFPLPRCQSGIGARYDPPRHERSFRRNGGRNGRGFARFFIHRSQIVTPPFVLASRLVRRSFRLAVEKREEKKGGGVEASQLVRYASRG